MHGLPFDLKHVEFRTSYLGARLFSPAVACIAGSVVYQLEPHKTHSCRDLPASPGLGWNESLGDRSPGTQVDDAHEYPWQGQQRFDGQWRG